MSASLYTFGSPRIGLFPFSRDITNAIGAESIFRVYHSNDPVSMVPLFPFVHAPASGPVIMLPSNQSAYDFSAHFMNGYVSDVSGGSWRSMRCACTNWLDRLDEQVSLWLESGDRSVLAHYGGSVIWFLGRALIRLIELSAQVVGAGLQTLVSCGLTLIDTLAWLLERASLLSAKIETMLGRILSAFLSAIGRALGAIHDITAAVIRYILSFLLTGIAIQVSRAISLVHR
jgi:hypothetical protein